MDLLNGAIPLGRWFGINVRIHIWFVFFIVFRLMNSPNWKMTLFFSGLLFLIVLLHEFGHCFGARAVGGEAHDILMWPLGGLAFARAPMTPWAQFVTVACGPLVNLIFCIISGAALVISIGEFGAISLNPFRDAAVPPQELWHVYASLFFEINYYLLLFNLLPVYPLDGGQLLHTLLWPLMGLQRSMILACQIGIGGAIVLFVLGIQTKNYILPAIAFFGALTCWQQLLAARSGMLIDDRFAAPEYGPHPPRRSRGGGFWARLFGRRSRPSVSNPTANPNPGGWEAKMTEESKLEAEVDRILKKVHDQGIQSLTYVEQQTLERATRERQRREREFQGRM